MLPFLASLWSALLRAFGRLRARRLRAARLPTAAQAIAGQLEGPRPSLATAVRAPGELLPPDDSDDYWALPFGARAIREPGRRPPRLLRLAALPRPPLDLPRLRLDRFRLDGEGRPSATSRSPSPALGRPLTPLGLALVDQILRLQRAPLSQDPSLPLALRPGPFGLDADFRPASAVWPLPGRAPVPRDLPLPRAATLARSLAARSSAAPLVRALGPAPAAASARRLEARGLVARARRQLPSRPAPRSPSLGLRVETGAARPDRFGLAEDGRTRVERSAPLWPERTVPMTRLTVALGRSRRPAARPDLGRVALQRFRLDPVDAIFANERILPALGPPARPSYLLPSFDDELCQPRWMSRNRLLGLSMRPVELFAYWWTRGHEVDMGPGEPVAIEQKREVWWPLFNELKEQMLIRRDVVRDAEGPPIGEFQIGDDLPAIGAHQHIDDFAELIPEKEWVPRSSVATGPVFDPTRPSLDAYVQWRTLVNGLEESV